MSLLSISKVQNYPLFYLYYFLVLPAVYLLDFTLRLVTFRWRHMVADLKAHFTIDRGIFMRERRSLAWRGKWGFSRHRTLDYYIPRRSEIDKAVDEDMAKIEAVIEKMADTDPEAYIRGMEKLR